MSELEETPTKRRCINDTEVLTYENNNKEENASLNYSQLVSIKQNDAQFANNLKNISAEAIEKCLNRILFTIDEDKLVREDIATLKSSSSRGISKLDNKMSIDSSLDAIEELCLYNSDASYFYKQDYASTIINICNIVKPIFQLESRILQLSSPVYCFGDIHGNLADFRKIARYIWPLGFTISAGKHLFLGDYVDRGDYGIEIVAYLFAQKIQNPNKVFLLRGNHETRGVNGWIDTYGNKCLKQQCISRYGDEMGNSVYEAINQVFDCLPLCCIIDNTIFCVHGGIPEPVSDNVKDRLSVIKNLPNNMQLYTNPENITGNEKNVVEELLWSDPCEASNAIYDSNGFCDSIRGSSKCKSYGIVAVNEFLKEYDFQYIIRAHQAIDSGIHISCDNKVITIFSTSKDHGFTESCIGIALIQDNDIVGIRMKENYVIRNKGRVVGVSDYFVDDEIKEKMDKGFDQMRGALLCEESLELRN